MASSARPIALEFDDIVYGLQKVGGISEYWRELTSRIAKCEAFDVRRRGGGPLGRMIPQCSSARVFHSSYYRTAFGTKTKTVTTVHDLAYELGYIGSGVRGRLHRLEHRKAYFSSDTLVCVSSRTKQDLLEVYPALAQRCEIRVVPHGVSINKWVRYGSQSGGNRPYVLFVGSRHAYKNFSGALLGFAASSLPREGVDMICTGSSLTGAESLELRRLGLEGRVRSVGPVDRPSLAQLYRGAYCLLYPSLFEGFGMPILEAMQLSCPVVTSNSSVMPEIAGEAALTTDARDPGAIAKALDELLSPELRSKLIELGTSRAARFTWVDSAAAHASVYRKLA